ncbi:MAG: hypothetical protein SO182_04045 [Paludibacteraceae bacterium]|nr:hypothetical protein [Paludibacteraceae bacterium]
MKKITLLMATLLCSAWCATAQTTEKGHEYVDLGLPSGLKWATCNVGATTPEAYGNYYAWGEIAPKETYSWDTYNFTADGGTTFTKYNATDGKTTLDPDDDVAATDWGGNWRMPTDDEWKELIDSCTQTWTTLNGINGYEIKSKINGNSIFLPATGFRSDEALNYDGSSGVYWSSTLDTGSPENAGGIGFVPNALERLGSHRYYGRAVRPVYAVAITALAVVEMPVVYAECGRIYCAGDFRIYDLLGRDVIRLNGSLQGIYIVKTADSAQKVVVK